MGAGFGRLEELEHVEGEAEEGRLRTHDGPIAELEQGLLEGCVRLARELVGQRGVEPGELARIGRAADRLCDRALDGCDEALGELALAPMEGSASQRDALDRAAQLRDVETRRERVAHARGKPMRLVHDQHAARERARVAQLGQRHARMKRVIRVGDDRAGLARGFAHELVGAGAGVAGQ